MTSDGSAFAIEKISTMSLGEFRQLLNSTLTVPPAEQPAVQESPRSQTGSDGGRLPPGTKSVRSTPSKSYKSVTSRVDSGLKPSTPPKPNLDSSSGYSSSPASDKTSSSLGVAGARGQRTATNSSSLSTGLSASKTSVKSANNESSSNAVSKANTLPKSRSSVSSISETSYTANNSRFNHSSRASSQSSLQSYESSVDEGRSLHTDMSNSKPVISPSSVDSDFSFRGSSGTSSDFLHSSSYTPCSAAEIKTRHEQLRMNARANSEPKEANESKPMNVGYASFSYEQDDKDINDVGDIELETMQSNGWDSSSECSQSSKSRTTRPQTPSGRATPSLIPRPMTPKMTRKLSLPQSETLNRAVPQEETGRTGRPPTPKRSTIIARAHGGGNVRAADKSKEQTYKEIFQKRSTTPGPGTETRQPVGANLRRSMTPGPYMNRISTMSLTSATTSRARLNDAREQNKDPQLSIFNGASNGLQSSTRKPLTKQHSEGETVLMVNVDRSENKHSVSHHGSKESVSAKPNIPAGKGKVLARARTEESRSRTPSRPAPSTPRQRPQSVEPRKLLSQTQTNAAVETKVLDRTQAWVETAVEQSKVKKTKASTQRTPDPRMRRCMTPNSFGSRLSVEQEEPRTLEEIKAALALPINGVVEINPDELEAPPEDAEMYATMEKLFQELRQQELKKSVNETPGSAVGTKGVPAKTRSRSSRSNSSYNDEEMSLDSNRNVRKNSSKLSATRSGSNVSSPPVARSAKGATQSSARPQSASRNSSVSSNGTSSGVGNSRQPAVNGRPSSPGPAVLLKRPPSPRTAPQTPRPASPKIPSHPPRPASPKTASQPLSAASPRVTAQPPRPQSPRVAAHPPRPQSPHLSRPASPRTAVTSSSGSSRASTPSRQPPRPVSTPPRPSTPVKRQGSKSSDDSEVFENDNISDSKGLLNKIKEIINVKPRKDKADGVKQKTRIPAPKSLASVGKSQSFSNLSNLSFTSPVNGNVDDNYDSRAGTLDSEVNDYTELINGGLNVTLTGRSETPGPKLITPMTTGRSSLIRKESMEKNKNATNRLTRAVSLDKNMVGLQNGFMYDEGEYV